MKEIARSVQRLTKVYRILLRAYSPRFRRAYSAEMAKTFQARCVRAIEERGRPGLILWVCRAILDVAWNAPLERISTWREARGAAAGSEVPAKPGATPGDSGWVGLMQDFRFVFRLLARRPALAVTLVLTLGLGTGATTALFGIMDAALLRALPYPNADDIVLVRQSDPEFGAYGFAPPYIADLRERITGLESLAGFSSSWDLTLTGLGDPRLVVASYVTDGLFDLFGATPLMGRLFDRTEYATSGGHAVVVSRAFWERNFGTETTLGAQALTLEGEIYPIVGVLPALPMPITASIVDSNGASAEVWLPFSANPYAELRSIPVMNVVGRLPDGGTVEAVAGELDSVREALVRDYPDIGVGTTLVIDRLREVVTRDVRRTVLTLFTAAGLLLLIACVNVANMLLALSTARGQELAVRRALGAGRRRIARQLLAESLVIATLGCMVGLALGAWLTSTVLRTGVAGLPPSADVRVDLRVAGFAALLAVATTVFFGVAPALHAVRSGVLVAGGDRRATGVGRRTRNLFVAAEVALAVTLLVGAGLLERSFWNLVQVDPGFRAEGLLQIPMGLSSSGRDTPGSRRAFLDHALGALEALPGASAVAAVNRLPLGGSNVFVDVEVEGEGPAGEARSSVDRRVATPGYFDLMRIPIVAGREFGPDDLPASPIPAAIVNETFVRRRLPDGSPVGRRLRLMLRGGPGPWLTVVGVAGDVQHHGLDGSAQPEVYVPYAQASVESMVAVVHTTDSPAGFAETARKAIWTLDPNMPLDEVLGVEELLRSTVAEPRFRAVVLNGFAALALVLAAMGIYGVIAYAVERRTRETGVRVALGARPSDVVLVLVGEGVRSAAVGALIGLAGAWALGQALSPLLFEVGSTDALTFGGVSALILVVALTASYLPARRAAQVDPVDALRAD